MKLGTPDDDPVVEQFTAIGNNGRRYNVRKRQIAAAPDAREPFTGKRPHMATVYWFEAAGMEFTEETDGALVTDQSPGLVLRRESGSS